MARPMSKWDTLKSVSVQPLRVYLSHLFSGVGTDVGTSSYQFAVPNILHRHSDILKSIHMLAITSHAYISHSFPAGIRLFLIDLRGPWHRLVSLQKRMGITLHPDFPAYEQLCPSNQAGCYPCNVSLSPMASLQIYPVDFFYQIPSLSMNASEV